MEIYEIKLPDENPKPLREGEISRLQGQGQFLKILEATSDSRWSAIAAFALKAALESQSPPKPLREGIRRLWNPGDNDGHGLALRVRRTDAGFVEFTATQDPKQVSIREEMPYRTSVYILASQRNSQEGNDTWYADRLFIRDESGRRKVPPSLSAERPLEELAGAGSR